MENLISLEYHGKPVRCIQKDGAPWWVLSDVCKVLDLSNSRMTAKQLDDDEKGVSQIYTLGGNQKVTVINESGLYNVLLRSDKPEAKPFKRWVTHEVLPQIRQTGRYEPKPEQLSLPMDGAELVDILEIEERTGVTRDEVRACMRLAGNLVYGDDYMVLRNESLMMYKRQRPGRAIKASAITVFTRSGMEKLKPYLQSAERKPETPEPQALPFDEMMKLRYNRITQAQMLLHIADRTPDANQRNYLYGYITELMMEEDLWNESDHAYNGKNNEFDSAGLEGYCKRANLDWACCIAQSGKPVTHKAVEKLIEQRTRMHELEKRYRDNGEAEQHE